MSVGSYYRWHWESRKLSRRCVPNAVDTPYECLLREFGRRTRASRKHYLACKREVRGEKGVVRKRTAYLINILIAYVCLPEVQNLNTIQHNILNELLTVGSLLTN